MTIVPDAAIFNSVAYSPTITVKNNHGETLKEGQDYTVSVPAGRIMPGDYVYTVAGTGEYNGVVTKTFTVLPHTPHAWNGGILTAAPTCAKEGVTTYTCIVCGATKTESVPKTTTHTWDDGKITTAATCTKDGVKTYTCTVCQTTRTEAVKATGHSYGDWKKLDANQHRRVCANDSAHVEKADHTWDGGIITTPATCTKDGVKTYTCAVCKGTKTEVVKAAGHQYGAWIITKNATCAAAGELTRTCSGCGKKETTAIEKTGEHVWDEGKVTTPAKCEKDGVKTYTCTVCQTTRTEAVKATGHSYGDWKKLDGNQHQRVCANNSAHVENAPHTWDAGKVTKQPDCANNGERVYTCSVCGAKKTETIPATGEHTLTGWTVAEPAGPGKAGKISRTCTVCGQTFYETLDPLPPTDGKQKPGDVDGDGELTSGDARLALRASVGLEKDIVKGSAAYAAADADGDGEVTSGDARLILRASVGLEDASKFGKKA